MARARKRTSSGAQQMARKRGASARVVFVAVLALAGCGTGRRSAAVQAPPALDESERSGEALFFWHCHQCHPTGSAGLGPSLNDKPAPDAVIRLQVRKGLGAMPAFSERELPERDLDHIVRYVRALRRW